jgi:hypothetical protein
VKILLIFIFVFTIVFTPVYGQLNPSLISEDIEIPYYDFNRVARDSTIIELDSIHELSWEVTLDNDVMYANPDGNVAIRLYDANIEDKFIELGMGSPPDKKYWVAVQIPGEEGYVVLYDKLERGWPSDLKTRLVYSERAGLTVNNGDRIVISKVDIGSFTIKGYSVFGMEGSTDPPAASSGVLKMNVISGDPTKNQIQLFPYVLAVVIGIIVAVLLVTKKRS